jgi:hypothetical protein
MIEINTLKKNTGFYYTWFLMYKLYIHNLKKVFIGYFLKNKHSFVLIKNNLLVLFYLLICS